MVRVFGIEVEQHVNAGRLDVRIHDADAPAFSGQKAGQVGRGVGFSRSASKGMNRDNFRHGVLFAEVGRSIEKALCQVKDIMFQKVPPDGQGIGLLGEDRQKPDLRAAAVASSVLRLIRWALLTEAHDRQFISACQPDPGASVTVFPLRSRKHSRTSGRIERAALRFGQCRPDGVECPGAIRRRGFSSR